MARDIAEADDGKRGKVGVVVTVVRRPDAKVRLVFDDVERRGSEWAVAGLFTWKEMTRRSFRKVGLTEAQLADLGFNLIARLRAQQIAAGRKRGKRRSRK